MLSGGLGLMECVLVIQKGDTEPKPQAGGALHSPYAHPGQWAPNPSDTVGSKLASECEQVMRDANRDPPAIRAPGLLSSLVPPCPQRDRATHHPTSL